MYFLYVLHKVGNFTNIYNKTCILLLYSFFFVAICAVFMFVVILQLVTSHAYGTKFISVWVWIFF